jgi:hypothetical protein
MMRTISVLVLCALLCVTAGCVRPQKYIDVTCGKMPGDTLLDREAAIQCQTFKKTEAATAVYTEASLLVKSYRACLGKYEGMPADRAKEYCAEYPKALANVTCLKVAGEIVLGPEVAIQCQQAKQDEAATAVYNEATFLLKSYRACLEKYEQAPARAREYCGQYGKALQDIGLQIKGPLEADLSPKDTARTPAKSKY